METTSKDLAEEIETNMLVLVKSSEHSKSLNELKTNAIIIASNGMMSGGRILHHLFRRLGNVQDTILIAGYQAEGTRGRDLMDGKPTIRIFGHDLPVRCQVEHMTAMSGHADREELFKWLDNFKSKPKITFCTHGEGNDLQTYAKAIRDKKGWNVIVPKYKDVVRIFDGI
jgi:metallo-beta-lactamase family protein